MRHSWYLGSSDYPIAEDLPDRPRVLRGEGARPDAFAAPRVAIVGTRSASPHGLADAHETAAFLASAGITIVSGLAIGIDGAAHRGALDAGGLTVGVVATGLDVEYPRRHRALYRRVRANGLVVTEHRDGVLPRPERFPPRNRIIAALAQVVVVIEMTITGGARHTVDYALKYGRDVFALPGSRRNPAAAGCNVLIAEGAQPLVDPGDVLVALGRGGATGWREPPEACDPDERRVLRAFGGDAATVDQLVERTKIGTARVAAALRRMELSGRAEPHRGRWWPR